MNIAICWKCLLLSRIIKQYLKHKKLYFEACKSLFMDTYGRLLQHIQVGGFWMPPHRLFFGADDDDCAICFSLVDPETPSTGTFILLRAASENSWGPSHGPPGRGAFSTRAAASRAGLDMRRSDLVIFFFWDRFGFLGSATLLLVVESEGGFSSCFGVFLWLNWFTFERSNELWRFNSGVLLETLFAEFSYACVDIGGGFFLAYLFLYFSRYYRYGLFPSCCA